MAPVLHDFFVCVSLNLFSRLTYCYSLSLCIPVPLPRVGHGDSGGAQPDQPDAHRQPRQEDQVRRGAQAPLDLRK